MLFLLSLIIGFASSNECVNSIRTNVFNTDTNTLDFDKLHIFLQDRDLKDDEWSCFDKPGYHACSTVSYLSIDQSLPLGNGEVLELKTNRTVESLNHFCVPEECTETSLTHPSWTTALEDLKTSLKSFIRTCEDDDCMNVFYAIEFLGALSGLSEDFQEERTEHVMVCKTQESVADAPYSNECVMAFYGYIFNTDQLPVLPNPSVLNKDGQQIMAYNHMQSSVYDIALALQTPDFLPQMYYPPLGNHGSCLAQGTDWQFCQVSVPGQAPAASVCIPMLCGDSMFNETFMPQWFDLEFKVLSYVFASASVGDETPFYLLNTADFMNSVYQTAILGQAVGGVCVNHDTEKDVKKPHGIKTKLVIALFALLMFVVLIASIMEFLTDHSRKPAIMQESPDDYMLLEDEPAPGRPFNFCTADIMDFIPVLDLPDSVDKYFTAVWSIQVSTAEIFYPGKPVGFQCLDGIRAFSMSWVLMAHAYLYLATALPGYTNTGEVYPPGYLAKWTAMPISNGFFSVDSFFFLSGFLGMYVCIRKLGPKVPFPWTSWPFNGLHIETMDIGVYCNSFLKQLIKVPFIYLNRQRTS